MVETELPSAEKKRHLKKQRSPLPWSWALGLFAVLLILPIWGGVELSHHLDWRIVVTSFVLISILTGLFYWSDKRKAAHDQWRIPEGTLHLLELLGGWPAALLAQRFLRHKTKKARYQAVFWLIVFAHQVAALELITGWGLSRAIIQRF